MTDYLKIQALQINIYFSRIFINLLPRKVNNIDYKFIIWEKVNIKYFLLVLISNLKVFQSL